MGKIKITLIGPIGDIGGRELETGFIAKCLSREDCTVKIISTVNLSKESQLFDFVPFKSVSALNEIIYKNSFWFRILSYFASIKARKRKSVLDFVSNSIAKKTGYHKYVVNVLKNVVDNADIILFCAQVTSTYVKEVVSYANSKNIPTVIRTSGSIRPINSEQKAWLEKVTKFIHHSETNALMLQDLNDYDYTVIDQCTFKEQQMLKLPPVNQFKTLLFIGRLSHEKGILELVKYLSASNYNIRLNIIGDGPLYKVIEDLTESNPYIELLGFKNQDDIIEYIEASDCIIIPSYEESGPLVGLEAMASARLVISTKVGAMPYRLRDSKNQFWFDINQLETLDKALNELLKLTNHEIKDIAEQNRAIYIDNYAQRIVESQYKKTIFSLLKT